MKKFGASFMHLIRRSLIVTGIVAVAVIILISGTVFVFARSGDDNFPGTTSPGSHEFWDRSNPEVEFCSECHSGPYDEMVATGTLHQGTQCLFCHGIDMAAGEKVEHTAKVAKCSDCHADANPNGSETTELLSTNEAHRELPAQLLEDETNLSKACIACHTKVDVDINLVPSGPIILTQEK